MKKWEDIVKDKLEESDSPLPDSVFAEFSARREKAGVAVTPRRSLPVWLPAMAIAAGLAVILFLHRPSLPDHGVRVASQPLALVAETAVESDMVGESDKSPNAIRPEAGKERGRFANRDLTVEEEVAVPTAEGVMPDSEKKGEAVEIKKMVDDKVDISAEASPFIPQKSRQKRVAVKVASASGILAGSGLLTAILRPHNDPKESAGPGTPDPLGPIYIDGDPFVNGSSSGAGGEWIEVLPDPPADELRGGYSHSFPFRGGLSVGIPIAERLRIAAGLEYSLYSSSCTFTLSGEKKQKAHYLGVPVHLDWMWTANKWMDVYIGGGLEGNICLAATLGGEKINKDGFSLSLLGTGGVQFNFAKRFGLYVEPQVNWSLPLEGRVLETYRSEHPLMFSVATGLRFNLGK